MLKTLRPYTAVLTSEYRDKTLHMWCDHSNQKQSFHWDSTNFSQSTVLWTSEIQGAGIGFLWKNKDFLVAHKKKYSRDPGATTQPYDTDSMCADFIMYTLSVTGLQV